MKLIASTTSPFARKALVAAHELGLSLEVEYLVTTVLAPNAALGAVHPLIKLPTLITDDGLALFDSRVIVEYLQSLAPASTILPQTGPARFLVLRTQALADGILEAAISVFYESMFRPEGMRSEAWVAAQTDKARRGLAELEATTETWARTADSFDIGQIAIACTVGWIDFRDVVPGARSACPALYTWFDSLAERPSMQATVPRAPAK